MKLKLIAWLLLPVFLFGLSSCRPEKQEPIKYSELEKYPVTVGNITLEEKPDAIVSLSAAATQTLVELGFLDKIIAVSSDSVLPDRELPVVGSSQKPNFEQILALSPDLVVTDYSFPLGQMTAFTEQGIDILTLSKETGEYREILELLNGNPEVINSENPESSN